MQVLTRGRVDVDVSDDNSLPFALGPVPSGRPTDAAHYAPAAVPVDYVSFVRTCTPALLRTAYLLAGDAAGAEELVQDTLVRLYPKWDRVAAADAPLAYVRRSLANAHVNQRRRASRREFAFADVPERPDTHDALGQLDDRDQIRSALLGLPERQRTAIVLRYYEDLEDADIAAALGARPGTVRSLISRGLATLRDQLPTGALPPEPGWTA